MAMMAQVGEWMANAFLGALKHLTAGLGATVQVVKVNLEQAFQVAGLTLQKIVAEAFNSISEGMSKIGIDLGTVDVSAIQSQIDGITFEKPGTSWSKFNKGYLDAMGDWKVSTQGVQDLWGEYSDTQDRILKNSGLVERSLEERKKAEEAAAFAAIVAAKATEEQAAAEALVAEKVRLTGESKEAIARGDTEAVKVIKDALKTEEEILKRTLQSLSSTI